MRLATRSFFIIAFLILTSVFYLSFMCISNATELKPQYGTNRKFLAPIDAVAPNSIAISAPGEFDQIRSNLSGKFHLTADIDLKNIDWIPIGSELDPFCGTFDGQGFVIRNLNVNTNYNKNGLFYKTLNCVIKNVGFENTSINNGDEKLFMAGALCGDFNDGTISNCYNTGSIRADNADDAFIGGIIGNGFNATITNCYNTGVVNASGGECFAGGIAALVDSDSAVNSCFNTGAITASAQTTAYAGGLIGLSDDATGELISLSNNAIAVNCYNAGNVFAKTTSNIREKPSYAGGIFAAGGNISKCYNDGNISASGASTAYASGIALEGDISVCYNAGNVSASANAKAVAGGISATGGVPGTGSNTNCYNNGNVSATAVNQSDGYAAAGGISGHGIGNKCYNTGVITATSNSDVFAGGICGDGNGPFDSCYWNTTVTNSGVGSNSTVSGVTGLNDSQMKDEANFVGFDFESVWSISSSKNNGYPFLQALPVAGGAVTPVAPSAEPPKVTPGVFDIEKETITLPEDFSLAAFSIDGGRKWKTCTSVSAMKLPNLINKNISLTVTNKYDKKRKQPASGSIVIEYQNIVARPKANAEKLKPNYLLKADSVGDSTGFWILTKGGVGTESVYEGYLISADDGKTWECMTAEGIPVPSSGKGTVRYLIRSAPISTEQELIPASKAFKVSVARAGKAPSVKVDYKTETIKIKSNQTLYFGEVKQTATNSETEYQLQAGSVDGLTEITDEIDSVEEQNVQVELRDGGVSALVDTRQVFEPITIANKAKTVTVSLSDYLSSEQSQILSIRVNATEKKPASIIKTLNLAKRAILPKQELTVNNGKVEIPNTMEIYVDGKWRKSVPKSIKSSTTIPIRVKATAKTEKTGVVTGSAASKAGELSLTYGVYDEEKNKEGILKAVIIG